MYFGEVGKQLLCGLLKKGLTFGGANLKQKKTKENNKQSPPFKKSVCRGQQK